MSQKFRPVRERFERREQRFHDPLRAAHRFNHLEIRGDLGRKYFRIDRPVDHGVGEIGPEA